MRRQTSPDLRKLAPEQVTYFHEEGYLTSLPAISAEQSARCRAQFEAIDPARLAALECPWHAQAHLLFTWADEIVRHPAILDTVEDLIGPDILVEAADLFVKEPHSGGYISFHQDSYYWEIEPNEIISAWVALGEATVENGCMQYAARTHLRGKQPHAATFESENQLSRGQVMELPEGTRVIDVVLRPGEMSLHHCLLAHASGPNSTDSRRLGLAIRYFPPYVRVKSGPPMTATLVRGEDRYGYFGSAQPRPKQDLDAAAVAAHRKALAPHAASDYATA